MSILKIEGHFIHKETGWFGYLCDGKIYLDFNVGRGLVTKEEFLKSPHFHIKMNTSKIPLAESIYDEAEDIVNKPIPRPTRQSNKSVKVKK